MCYSKSRYESIDFDIHGTILLEDELGFHCYEHGGNIVKMSKASKDGEYGLGDKATQMNLKGKD
jgi:alpha-glucosidase